MNKEIRPWGEFEVLYDGSDYKIKIITVYPQSRFSLQYHGYRREIWTVIEGTLVAEVDDVKTHLFEGDTICVPRGSCHRGTNNQTKCTKFIEIQKGDRLLESDVIRIEDDYDRETQ